MGCAVNGFLFLYKVYQGWGLQRRGPSDPPKENGCKFAPTAPIVSFSRCFLWSKRLSPNPSVSNLSLTLCRYLSMVTRSSSQGSVDDLRHRGKVAEIGDLWFALGENASWSKITKGKHNYRVFPRRNLEAIGAVGANLRPFSFGGSVGSLRWSPQPW